MTLADVKQMAQGMQDRLAYLRSDVNLLLEIEKKFSRAQLEDFWDNHSMVVAHLSIMQDQLQHHLPEEEQRAYKG